jgi:Zn-dependent protease/CBS domain-containing protein
MKYSFKIGSVWGVPVELHFTFLLLILAVFILFFPDFYTPLLFVFLFVFVLFHELAHSYIAKRYGIKVTKIVLYPIGGISEIDEVPENSSIEFNLAIIGPGVSLLLGVILLVLSPVVYLVTAGTFFVLVGRFVSDLAYLNLFLGAFNLIPAYPMDGGRVFRALLSRRYSFSKSTKIAVALGRIVGVGMVIYSLIFFNPILLLVGVFVFFGASAESEYTLTNSILSRVKVKDVMGLEIGAVSSEQNIAEALQVMFNHRYHDALVEKEGVYLGLATWAELIKIDPQQRMYLKVGEMPLKKICVTENQSINEASKIMASENIDTLPVFKPEDLDHITGILTKESINETLDKAKAQVKP